MSADVQVEAGSKITDCRISIPCRGMISTKGDVFLYRIFAEFDSHGAAVRAADRLRSGAPGLGRITISAKNKSYSHTTGADINTFAAESAVFTANNFFTNSALPLASALGEGRTLSHERYRDPLEEREHILRAEGPRDAVEKAARLLRFSGGRSITFSGDSHR